MTKFFQWVADHPWIIVGAVCLISVGFLTALPGLKIDTDFTHYIDREDPAVQAMSRAEERYGDQALLLVAIENENGIFNPDTLGKIYRLQQQIETLRGVDEVTGPLNVQVITGTETSIRVGPAAPGGAVPETSEEMKAYRERLMESAMARDYIVASNGKAASIVIRLDADADRLALVEELLERIAAVDAPPETIHVAGLSYMNVVLTRVMLTDLRILLPLVFFTICAVLYWSFRSPRGILVPVLVSGLATLWCMGLMAVFHIPVTVISFILPVILLAIGIAYGIHVLNHFYEETTTGLDGKTVVVRTGRRMAAPVLMTGLTTGAGFLSLLSSLLIPQRQFGLFAAIGVLFAMGLSLILIPALLKLLPTPRPQRIHRESKFLKEGLGVLGKTVRRSRRTILIVSTVLFAGCLAGLPFLQVEVSQRSFLGKNSPVVQAMDAMTRHFSGAEQLMIEVDTGWNNGMKEPAVLHKIAALETFLKEQGVRKTVSLAGVVREMNQKFHADDPSYAVIPENQRIISQLLFLFTGQLGNMALGNYAAGEVMGIYPLESSEQQVRLVRDVQAYLDAHFAEGIRVEMVGPSRIQANLFSGITRSQLKSLGTSIVAAGIIVTVLMTSLVAGFISLIPLLLTVAVNFGIMAYSGTPLDMATLMVSAIAIGIGIDYAIHFIARFRRETVGGSDLEKALQTTLQTTGRGIASNALALSLGFIVLLFSSFKGTSNFGLLIAMTMLISAASAFTIIPAIFLTWNPQFLKKEAKVFRKNDLEGSDDR